MKRIILPILLASVLPNALFAQQSTFQYAGTIPNCIARWTFDGSNQSIVTDSSGNNNNGTLTDVITAIGWRDVQNQGGKFNGISSYGTVPNSTLLQINNATIIALVKFDDFYNGTCQGNEIVSKGYPDGINGRYCLRTTDNDYDLNCYVTTPGKQMLQSGFTNDNVGPTIKPTIESNKWYFLATTFQNGVEKILYQVQMDTGNYNPPVSPIASHSTTGYTHGTNSFPVKIGTTGSSSFPYWFNGTMDELIIFDRVLDRKELIAVYDFLWKKGIAPPSTTTGIKENEIKQNVSYSFNGTVYHFNIQNGKEYNAVVCDATGRQLKSFTLSNNTELNLNEYAQQIFFLIIFDSHNRYTIKLKN